MQNNNTDQLELNYITAEVSNYNEKTDKIEYIVRFFHISPFNNYKIEVNASVT